MTRVKLKQKLIDLLNSSMWFPESSNDVDWEVAKKLNAILSDIIIKIIKEDEN